MLLSALDKRLGTFDIPSQIMVEDTNAFTNWKELNLLSAKELRKALDVAEISPDKLPGGDAIHEAIAILRNVLGVSVRERKRIISPIGDAFIDDNWLPHIVEKRDSARERYANWIIPTIERPTEIWQSIYGEDERKETRNRFIKLFSDGKNDMLVVVSLDRDNIKWNAIPMPTRSVDNQREGGNCFIKVTDDEAGICPHSTGIL